jgi:hypothetical protein
MRALSCQQSNISEQKQHLVLCDIMPTYKYKWIEATSSRYWITSVWIIHVDICSQQIHDQEPHIMKAHEYHTILKFTTESSGQDQWWCSMYCCSLGGSYSKFSTKRCSIPTVPPCIFIPKQKFLHINPNKACRSGLRIEHSKGLTHRAYRK